jgi:hypothetical protein
VTWLANGLDPDHAKLIREALIASAGGEDALARDGGWQHYRWTRAGEARSMLRAIRDDEIRRGSRRPRSMREVEIWRQGEAERAERLAARIARARRRRAARDAKDEAFENMPMAEALETLSDDGSAASRPS